MLADLAFQGALTFVTAFVQFPWDVLTDIVISIINGLLPTT